MEIKDQLKFMEIKDGKSTTKEYKMAFNGKIRAACNGLIVLERDPKTADGLILHNPVTKEDEDIPFGSISSTAQDLYGLAFCHVSRRYKLLHLFSKDKSNLGCEIMDIGSGTWRAVEMPPDKDHYMCLQNPVFAMGALHWVQYVADHEVPCMVSMPLDDEKYKTIAIRETGRKYLHNNLVFAMGEFLGFASRVERAVSDNHQIGVWILRGLGGECGWEKLYNSDVGSGLTRYYNMTTLLCYGGDNGHVLIFKCAEDGCLYAYDHGRHYQHLRKIEDSDNVAGTLYWRIFPFDHVKSLASWRRS